MIMYGLLIILYCISIHFTADAMDGTPRTKKDHAVQWIDRNTIAIASSHGCDLVSDIFSKTPTIKNINLIPTSNLICNREETLLGCMSEQYFTVYDISDIKKIKEEWHQFTGGKPSSATFGPHNSIFICIKDQLFSNQSKLAPTLPFTGASEPICIDCHPNKKEIAYPLHSTTLTIRSLESIFFSANHYLEQIQEDAIQQAIYSPSGSHIALLTRDRKVFIHDVTTKTTRIIGHYHGATFFDDSIIALIYTPTSTIDFWNYKTQKLIAWKHVGPGQILHHNYLPNILGFYPDQWYFAAIVENKYNTYPISISLIKNKCIFLYWLMKQFFCNPENQILPPDMVKLIMFRIIEPHLYCLLVTNKLQ